MAHATTPSQAAFSALLHAYSAAVSSEWMRAARGDVRAVHRIRTSSRRLRELLPAIETAVPGLGAARLRRETRRLARELGAARELDVALETLDSGIGGEVWTGPGAVGLRRAMITARARVGRASRPRLRALDPAAWRTRADALIVAVANAPAGAEWAIALVARLARRAGRLDAAVTAAGTLYAPEPLHRVRLAAKKLRYALEITRDVGGAAVGPQLTALKTAQDRLGRMHDLHVLGLRLRDLAPPAGRRPIRAEYTALAAAIDRECREEHAVFLASRAGLLVLAKQAAGAVVTGRRRTPIRMKLGAASQARRLVNEGSQ